jgi:hypothetical protein
VLRADTQRIRQELGGRKEKLVVPRFYGLTVAVPTIHPWVEKAVTEGAEIDSGIVERFLRLDRQLTNMRHLLALFQESAAKQNELGDSKTEHMRSLFEAWIQQKDVSALVKRAPEGRLVDFENATQFARDGYLDEHNAASDTLEDIDARLNQYLD